MFEIIILIGAVCGVIMVIGSMFLLYKGSISLKDASEKEALSIEVINEIKLSTRYPALALFVIGFIFFISAAWFAKEGDTKKITLAGTVSSPDKLSDIEIHLSAGPWKQNISDDSGTFSILFYPNVKSLKATIVAPGYKYSGISKDIKINQNIASMGTIKLGPKLVENVVPKRDNPPRQAGGTTNSGGTY